MSTGINPYDYFIASWAVPKFIATLPLHRRLLAYLPIQKWKIQKEEYEKWFFRNLTPTL